MSKVYWRFLSNLLLFTGLKINDFFVCLCFLFFFAKGTDDPDVTCVFPGDHIQVNDYVELRSLTSDIKPVLGYD